MVFNTIRNRCEHHRPYFIEDDFARLELLNMNGAGNSAVGQIAAIEIRRRRERLFYFLLKLIIERLDELANAIQT